MREERINSCGHPMTKSKAVLLAAQRILIFLSPFHNDTQRECKYDMLMRMQMLPSRSLL